MNVPFGVLSSVMTNKQNERAILSISRASLGALAVQSESAMKGIRIMFYYAPLAVFAGLLVLLAFYHLDKEYGGIMEVLDRRHTDMESAGYTVKYKKQN